MDPDQFPTLRSRRDFFRVAACAALGTAGLTNCLRDLRLINSAMAQTPNFTDYKALICIFLSGGHDSNNLIIPTIQSEYNNYSAIRQNLALPLANVLPVTSTVSDNHTYGLHPACTELQTLFNENKLAVLFNTGTLLHPITRAQYQAKSVATPPQLFSHSDQVTQWQTSIPDQPPRSGWGGRIADLLDFRQPDGKISMCTSIAGANTFQVGIVEQQYHVSTGGAVTLGGVGTTTRLQAMKDIIGVSKNGTGNLQRKAYAEALDNAIATGDLLNNNLGGGNYTMAFPTSSLGKQLKMIARIIEGRSLLGMKRQIFFCSVGGYDTHTSQVANNGATEADRIVGNHTNLLTEISKAVLPFQRAMEQIGTSNMVTSFTASDFGRTFPTNGQGSDHGWGSHHMIIGGAVKGKQTYGKFPTLAVNGPDDTSTGRWIPTTSVDEYSATLARWFGVAPNELSTIFPNLGRFATSDLGFMT